MQNSQGSGEKLSRLGYRRTSRQHGIVSRIDRPDWLEFLASQGYFCSTRHLGSLADTYRRTYSKDCLTLSQEEVLKIPTSSHDSVGFVPKNEVEKRLLYYYKKTCPFCGSCRNEDIPGR